MSDNQQHRPRPQAAFPPFQAEAATRTKGWVRETLEVIVAAVILALVLRTFVVQAFKIPSGSMEPTLDIGDHLMVNKFIYGIRQPFSGRVIIPVSRPHMGDVIVFIYPLDPSKDFIKRVIGVGGDTVEVRDKRVLINGVPVKDSAAWFDPGVRAIMVSPRDNFGPVTVPPGKLFVMGDNRDHSYDSRFWGFVDLEAVRGKAFIIYWSWDSEHWRLRWKRLGHLIH